MVTNVIKPDKRHKCSAAVVNQSLKINCPHCKESFFIDVYLTEPEVVMIEAWENDEKMQEEKKHYAHM